MEVYALRSLSGEWKNGPLSWRHSDDPCGNWDGVNCSNSIRVTELDFSNNKYLNGQLPPSIGNLKKLQTLILIGCKFSGTIPVELDEEQESDDSHLNLCHRSLNANHFTSRIPASLGRLADLVCSSMNVKHILLDSNNLSGVIPESIGLLQKLEVLRLDRNNLIGLVPQSISNLTRLKVLNFANNELTGMIPNMTGMHALYNLDLSNNSFDPSE
ncbi:hypothetical protein ZIOFF_021867 [Zingiber officinale]|uniref:Leucine-rich repeat-containing N-terminal plant-type domain-containing protein n=1 Tax=Zingiber officinale TaxID=94328 RepID=A0A8J5HAE0_ZINOF|nr:hypothetical protein ZIOFF_021867 [Zingiber officinale]